MSDDLKPVPDSTSTGSFTLPPEKRRRIRDPKHSEHDLREELIEFLLSRSGKHDPRSIRWKVRMWNMTVSATYALKRGLDVVASCLLLIMLSPLFLLTAILIRLDSPGPLIFRQIRVGLDGRHFNFYKFRSMYIDAEKRKKDMESMNESSDGVIFKMKRDPRITRVGRFIRKFSIDELPQLVNVLTGDMSLIGPRPPLPSEVDKYSLDDRKRLHVVPGITGLWQISGRSDIGFKQQVALDKEYILSRSLWGDILIMLKTIPAVLTGRGAY